MNPSWLFYLEKDDFLSRGPRVQPGAAGTGLLTSQSAPAQHWYKTLRRLEQQRCCFAVGRAAASRLLVTKEHCKALASQPCAHRQREEHQPHGVLRQREGRALALGCDRGGGSEHQPPWEAKPIISDAQRWHAGAASILPGITGCPIASKTQQIWGQ